MQDNNQGLLGRDLVFAPRERDGAFGAGQGFDVETWCGSGEAEGFAHDAGTVGEFVEMRVGEFGGAEYGVDFGAGGGDAGGVFEEVVDCGGDGARGGAGANGHGHNFVDDLGVCETFACFGVFGCHHDVQHIFSVCWVLLSVFDAVGGVLAHGGTVFVEFGLIEEPVYELGSGWPLDCFGRGAVHCLDHGRRWPRQAVKLSSIEAQCRRFDIKSVQFINCGDLRSITTQAPPLGRQLRHTVS